MALKFLNKKGWHTGSLCNIERVRKAEQAEEAEKRKTEELKKQVAAEREKAEFQAMQEAAGLRPAQERLDFLYDSGRLSERGAPKGSRRCSNLHQGQLPPQVLVILPRGTTHLSAWMSRLIDARIYLSSAGASSASRLLPPCHQSAAALAGLLLHMLSTGRFLFRLLCFRMYIDDANTRGRQREELFMLSDLSEAIHCLSEFN